MTIYTSYFANKKMPEDMIKVRISLGNPRWKTPYQISGTIKLLMPHRESLQLDIQSAVSDYKKKLSQTDIETVKKEILAFGENVILLCFENVTKDDSWCHRRIFAEWYEQKTGEVVQELPCG